MDAKKPSTHWLRKMALSIGFFVVIFGAAKASSQFASVMLGDSAAKDIFAPVALLDTSSSRINGSGTTTTPQTILTTLDHATSSTPIEPAKLIIPSIGVSADVEHVGKKEDGTMGTPTKFGNVAWYALGSKPGEPGNAVIDGHVNNALTTAGVFVHLSQVQIGDLITVADASGNTLTYVVHKLQEYPADAAPDASIFATTGPSQLVLITCQGDWVSSAKSFDKRLVVFASLQ